MADRPESPARAEPQRRLARLTLWMLPLLILAAFLVPLAGRTLNAFALGGLPLGFCMMAQGSLILFAGILWLYDWRARRIERDAALPE